MDNLRAIIRNLFIHINPIIILKNYNYFRCIPIDRIADLGMGYISRYSKDELGNLYHYLRSEFSWHNRKLSETNSISQNDQSINVFDTLSVFNFAVLTDENTEPKCRYQHLLRWREMISELEEDLFVTSYLAQADLLKGKERKQFFWKPVIGHNNFALNKMLAEGVAENHFHLKGSAPMFHLSWIALMNDPENPKFEKYMVEYNKNRLYKKMENGMEFGHMSLNQMWRASALIRLYLFTFITDDYISISNAYIRKDILLEFCTCENEKKIIEEIVQDKTEINLSKYDEELSKKLSNKIVLKIKQLIAKKWVEKALENRDFLNENLDVLRLNIYRLREKYKSNNDDYLFDYALCRFFATKNLDKNLNEIICGERWIMYTMFTHIYRGDKGDDYEKNLFYAYLVMKANIRAEIVQTNSNVGFTNFFIYQSRKEDFVDNDKKASEWSRIYLKMAVRDTLYSQPLKRLEVRITPKDSAEKIAASIRRYDECICYGLQPDIEQKLKKQFFYVCHFIKEADDMLNIGFKYRHYSKRFEVERQAKGIGQLRDLDYPESKRIMGIDASSTEIVCRPEVFAQAFRYLKNHSSDSYLTETNVKFPQLMSTYHVGEDFLDVIDGLRAIDEAIKFLNLKCGDRLGHALALGIDPFDWYQSKSNRIVISKQAYLDNLVWLHAKIRKYKLKDAFDVQNYILKKISTLIDEIYLRNISDEESKKVIESAREYAKNKNISIGHIYQNLVFDYNDYYDAWKLRGDNPELYKDGFFKRPFANMDEWEAFAVNLNYPSNYQIRYNLSVAYLYHLYHYNEDVRRTGDEIIEVGIDTNLIEVVKTVQYCLQQEISDLGICIETNPSSNCLIGTFKRYDKHPIVGWYNNGLTFDSEKLRNCPQICVSINTDDQGVFATYIENEYAYLALALEKCKDKNGNRLYNRTMILQWLDNIRKMGFTQSFYQDVDESFY